jgi:hypothetical protein
MIFFLILSLFSKNVLYNQIFAALSIFISTYISHYFLSRKNEKRTSRTSQSNVEELSVIKDNSKKIAL